MRTESSQRTPAVSCPTSSRRISSTLVKGCAVILLITGSRGGLRSVAMMARLISTAAGAINGEWAAMLIGKRIDLRAPRVFASSRACASEASSPEMTT